jgi:hypothetical protein
MRANTITTKARTIVPRGILALSLGVVLLAATTGTASAERGPTAALTGDAVTTPPPPPPPLTLSVDEYAAVVAKKLWFWVFNSNDSTLVVRGDVKRTTKQSREGTRFKVKLKHGKRLYEKPKFKVKVKAEATDEFGQTASDEIKYVLRRCPAHADYGANYGTPGVCSN